MNSELIIVSGFSVFVGLVGKVVWDWFKTGRARTGEYYMSTVACRANRSTCNIHAIADALAKQKNTLVENSIRLTAIEVGMKEAKKEAREELREAKKEARELRAEVSAIRSAVDKMAGAIASYAEMRKKREGDEDRKKRQL